MDAATRLIISTPNVIHDTIDGVSVIIDLASGRYYSLQDTATDLWTLVGAGKSTEDIIDTMTHRYDADGANVRQVVQEFLQQLLQENLIRADDNDYPVLEPVGQAASAPDPLAERPAFALPRLEVYKDLEDLLLLDPIHEVGDEGWPVARPADPDA